MKRSILYGLETALYQMLETVVHERRSPEPSPSWNFGMQPPCPCETQLGGSGGYHYRPSSVGNALHHSPGDGDYRPAMDIARRHFSGITGHHRLARQLKKESKLSTALRPARDPSHVRNLSWPDCTGRPRRGSSWHGCRCFSTADTLVVRSVDTSVLTLRSYNDAQA
jgi:hypothetical protein